MDEILSSRIPDQRRFASLSLDGARDLFVFFDLSPLSFFRVLGPFVLFETSLLFLTNPGVTRKHEGEIFVVYRPLFSFFFFFLIE